MLWGSFAWMNTLLVPIERKKPQINKQAMRISFFGWKEDNTFFSLFIQHSWTSTHTTSGWDCICWITCFIFPDPPFFFIFKIASSPSCTLKMHFLKRHPTKFFPKKMSTCRRKKTDSIIFLNATVWWWRTMMGLMADSRFKIHPHIFQNKKNRVMFNWKYTSRLLR